MVPVSEINDVGLTAVTRIVRGTPESFLSAGCGRLSTNPIWRALKCIRAVHQYCRHQGNSRVFRDRTSARASRTGALKFLFLRQGWTAEKILDELQHASDFDLIGG